MTTHHKDESLFDATIRVDNLPQTGRDLEVSATAEQLERLAQRLEVSEVDFLQARLHALPFRGGIRVQGNLKATVVQPCVVTFEPVTQEIDEPVDRVFLPGPGESYSGPANAEIFVDLEGDDMPDHFEGPEADLSELLVETLSLAIDPYPRAPGASLEASGIKERDDDLSPFASLKSLKNPDDKQ